MRLASYLALLALAGTPAAASARAETKQDAPKRESLQEFLKHLKSHQVGLEAQLRGGVDSILKGMESDALARRLEALDQARGKLVALGQEAVPLLLDGLDPGPEATDAQKLRSQFVMRALQDLASPAATDRLVKLAQTGSIEGRRNAIAVLGASPEPLRSAPVLIGIVKQNQVDLRDAALTALAQLGTPEGDRTLSDSLADANAQVVRATLLALAAAKNTSLAPRILQLVEVPRDAVQYIDPLLYYYSHVPAAADKRHILALVKLAADFTPPPEQRARILETLPLLAEKLDNDCKKELKDLSESPTKEVKEAALVVLVIGGDKNARRDLFADIELQIQRNKNFAQNYETRARLEYRIGEWRDAQKDFQSAIKLSADDFRARPEESYIGLARCYMQQNKLKEARDTLEKAPISLKQLQELSKEPVFQKLLENNKFRGVFRLDG
ncbi:MAG: tetratricopeptide repeat protein [Planctomycetes bacterium]|nr:tetratricopeptide repeat protein [Planctomycetota bacterium]